MKILFVHPEKYLNIGIPAGIAILSAIIKQNGHIVDLFDTTFIKPLTDKNRLIKHDPATMASAGDPLPTEEIQRSKVLKETQITINDLAAKDSPQDEKIVFQQKIDKFSPDIIAVSAMTTTFDHAMELIHSVTHQAKVVVGGIHATIAPKDCLNQSGVDIVCIGEGDDSFVELITLISQNQPYTAVRGMWFKNEQGSIIKNEISPRISLESLPTPDWSIFDERHLFRPFDGEVYKGSFFSQSRGCPMKCTYCVDPTISAITGGSKGYFRIQPPKTTYLQLKELKEKYGATWFKFVDDTFLLPKIEHLIALRDLIKPLNIMFGCSVMPNTITEEKVILAKDMGCVAMSIGLESGNDLIRKSVMRKCSNDRIIKDIQMVKKHGVRVSTFNIIGFPGESRANVFETVELNRKTGADAANVYILYPYPGTPIAIEKNIPLRDSGGAIPSADTAASLSLSKMSEQEVVGLHKTFNLYLHLDHSLHPLIKRSEKEDSTGNKLRTTLQNYTTDLLSKSNNINYRHMTKQEILNTDIGTKQTLLSKIKIPSSLASIFNSSLNDTDKKLITETLASHFTQ